MYEWVNRIRGEVEPIEDPIYGSLYRCSLTLKDGTFLPCAVIQPRQRLVDLAKRRIKEELEGKGRLGGDDPYSQIVTSFVTRGNRVNDYDVASSCVSKHAACYENSLLLANSHKFRTVAFPAISTGAYAYPPALAAGIAIDSIRHFVAAPSDLEQVLLGCYSGEDIATYKRALRIKAGRAL